MYKAYSSGLLGFGGRKIEDDIPLAVKYGYEGIIIDIKTESKKDSVLLKELLEKNKMKNGGFGLPLQFRESEDVFEEGIKTLPSLCELAQKIDANRCITWILPWSDTLDYKTNFELHKKRLTKVTKILGDYGIRFGLEFVGPPKARKGKKHDFIYNLDTLNDLIGEINNPNLGYLLDVYHWDLAGQTSDDFKKIPGKESIVMAHINDAPAGIPMDEQEDLIRELPGATGVLKIADFMKGLRDLQYDGPVYVEPFYAPFKTMAFEDALKMAKSAMDKVWL